MTMRRRLVIYTRDERVPLADDDREMRNGWQCIPIPPTDDGGWFIIDSSKDYKTGWCRRGLTWGRA
jgi:glucan-binding YG repeat protein